MDNIRWEIILEDVSKAIVSYFLGRAGDKIFDKAEQQQKIIVALREDRKNIEKVFMGTNSDLYRLTEQYLIEYIFKDIFYYSATNSLMQEQQTRLWIGFEKYLRIEQRDFLSYIDEDYKIRMIQCVNAHNMAINEIFLDKKDFIIQNINQSHHQSVMNGIQQISNKLESLDNNILNMSNKKESEKKNRFVLESNDPIKDLINEANQKTADGDYIGALNDVQQALDDAQQALTNAQKAGHDEKDFLLKVAYAKLQCALKMQQLPQYYSKAIAYLSDVLSLGVFEEFPETLFGVYISLANATIMNNEMSAAKSALDKAFSYTPNDDDIILCNSLKGKIAMCEKKYGEAISLFQSVCDELNLKIITRAYNGQMELSVIEQNLAATFNDMALAYQANGDIQNAMIYVKKAVDATEKEHLEFEHAIFLLNWGNILFDEEAYDSVIEKVTLAQDIFRKRNDEVYLVSVFDLLAKAYYMQDDLISSYQTSQEALKTVKEIEDKLYFSRKIARLSAELGDEKALNEQIVFIREFENFDEDNPVAAFEEWTRELQRMCLCSVPDNFKEQPETFFMYDEEDSYFINIIDEILKIKNTTNNVIEYNEKLKDFLLRPRTEVSEQEKDNLHLDKILKILKAKMNESINLSEKAQLMYEIGVFYQYQNNDTEADIWYLKAIDANGASKHTITWAQIAHIQTLMNKGNVEDNNKAKELLEEVEKTIKTSKNPEAMAVCKFYLGRLEARKGNFNSALDFFEKAYKVLEKGKIDNPRLVQALNERCASVRQYLHFEENPTKDLESLQRELLFLQTWYPEYSQQLMEYWWYYRGKEPLNNIRISGMSACVIYSDDKDEICWYSEALSIIFSHCLFAPKERWENIEHVAIRTIPVPSNTPFPYSAIMVYDEKVGGKVYGYSFQVDGSEQMYAYKRIQCEDDFDQNRIPKPIVLNYMGYSYPEIVGKISPIVDESSSCGWWVGPEFKGSPDALMNLVSRFGLIPVFHLDDINTSHEITILRNEHVNIPFIKDIGEGKKKKHIQKRLRHITSICDQETMFSSFDDIIDLISELPDEETPLISIHLAIVRFGYYVWDESPVQWRVYPAVIISSEDERRNMEITDVVSKSVASWDISHLMLKTAFYSRYNYSLNKNYIKEDVLKLIELSEYTDNEIITNYVNYFLDTVLNYNR
ncbi:MAG: hypothetical protein NC089_00345 [Bacteroides sp.]|nr:hypothetical protein [Bacteroides sp.]MCM1549338.1 hypothetical protein [Clostridium sp.]